MSEVKEVETRRKLHLTPVYSVKLAETTAELYNEDGLTVIEASAGADTFKVRFDAPASLMDALVVHILDVIADQMTLELDCRSGDYV